MSNSNKKSETRLKHVNALISYLQQFFNFTTVITLTAIIIVVFYQILARYALPKAPVWTEELSRYLFIYLIVFSSGTVVIKRRHITLDLYRARLSKKWLAVFDVTVNLIMAAFSIFLIKYSWQFSSVGAFQTSPALGVKMNWVFMSTFIFFFLVSITCLLLAIKEILTYRSQRTP